MSRITAPPERAVPPSTVPLADDCYYYHSIDLGDAGRVQGQWDLAPHLDPYWAGTEFRGKSVLEIGPASGYLTSELERRGATVTALELAAGSDWDVVPFEGWDRGPYLDERAKLQGGLRNSFWRTRSLLDLSAELLLGSVYNIPPSVGDFDIATVCAVLLHLRYPLDALQQVAARVSERIVVTEALPGECLDSTCAALLQDTNESGDGERLSKHVVALDRSQLHDPAALYLRPDASLQAPRETWWALTPRVVEAWLGVVGFEIEAFRFFVLEHDSAFAYHQPDGHVARRTFHPYYSLSAVRRA